MLVEGLEARCGGGSRYGYDQYDNMGVSGGNNVLPVQTATPTSNVFNSSNRMNGASYDGAGNQTSMQSYTLTYDGGNRLANVVNAPAAGGGSVQYGYDAEGRRVLKQYSDGGTAVYVYDALGKLAAEYSSGGEMVACRTCYLSSDYLGSVRMVTDASANVVGRHDYLPFGEEMPTGTAGRAWPFGNADGTDQRFTGKERDQETGLGYFGARYFSAAQGRFLSSDPFNAGADPTDPQTWNAYAYVRGNPLNLVDPSGMSSISCANTMSVHCDGSSSDFDEQYRQYDATQNLRFWGNYGVSYAEDHPGTDFLGNHLKSGHTLSLQNRPTEVIQNKSSYNSLVSVLQLFGGCWHITVPRPLRYRAS
jgi:RHS repeat-associated protein